MQFPIIRKMPKEDVKNAVKQSEWVFKLSHSVFDVSQILHKPSTLKESHNEESFCSGFITWLYVFPRHFSSQSQLQPTIYLVWIISAAHSPSALDWSEDRFRCRELSFSCFFFPETSHTYFILINQEYFGSILNILSLLLSIFNNGFIGVHYLLQFP